MSDVSGKVVPYVWTEVGEKAKAMMLGVPASPALYFAFSMGLAGGTMAFNKQR